MAKNMNAASVQLLLNWIATNAPIEKVEAFYTLLVARMSALSVSASDTPYYSPNGKGKYQVNLKGVIDWMNALTAPVSDADTKYLQSIREAIEDRTEMTTTT